VGSSNEMGIKTKPLWINERTSPKAFL